MFPRPDWWDEEQMDLPNPKADALGFGRYPALGHDAVFPPGRAERPDVLADWLVGLVTRLSHAESMAAIMEAAVCSARRVLEADGITFVLRDGECCHYADEDAIAPLWKGRRFPLSACISGWVMMNRETVVVPDIYRDARIPHDAYLPTFVRSLAMAPVRRADPIAALGAYWKATYRPSDQEVKTLEAIADTCSMAIASLGLRSELAKEAAARQVATQSSQAKSRFLAQAAHDLRQPLQALELYIELLRVQNVGEPVIARMRRAIACVGGLAGDLIDVSRLEAGVLKPAVGRVSLRELLAGLEPDFAALARSKGLGWQLSCPDLTVRTDAALLTRVLRNLMGNAIKYTSSGSVGIAVDACADGVALSVWDSGKGMDQAELVRAFGEYTRLNGQPTPEEGVGLGLAIVRQLTDALGIGLDARSTPGQGSVFRLWFR